MSYKSGETVYGRGVTRTGWVIASDAYIDNPDCKTYQVNGGGGIINDTDVLSGGVLNNTGASTGAGGGYIENIRISGGGTVNVNLAHNSGAQIAITGGTLAINTGATVKNVTQTGGTVNLNNAAKLSGLTQTAGKVLVTRASVTDATVAGNLNFGTGATAENLTITDGMTQFDPGAATTGTDNSYGENVRMTGGALVVKWDGTVVSNVQVSGGILYVRSQGIVRKVDVYDGGDLRVQNQGFGIISGATVHAGGKATQYGTLAAEFTDLTVEAGGSLTLAANFTLKGNINIAQGALTNDADAYAAGGTIHDLDLGLNGTFAFGSGITLSNFNQTAGTVDVNADAAVDTAALNAGTLNLNAGAAGADIEAMGGTLNVEETAELNGATVGGATVNVAAGAVARNLEVNAGTLNIAAGADVDGVTYNGGTFAISSGVTIRNFDKLAGATINMYGDAVVDGGVFTAGTLQALAANGASGAVIKNYAMRGGNLTYVCLRGTTDLLASNIAVSGGSLCIQAGASAANIDVYEGGEISTPSHQAGAKYTALRIHSGGRGVLSAGARTLDIDGFTMDAGATATIQAGKINDFNAAGGELTLVGSNYVSGGGTLNDLTVLGNGYLWINDPYDATSGGAAYSQMVNSNMTVEAGAWVFMHGTNVYGSDAQIYGSYYVQNGATLSGGTVHDGGYANMWLRNNYNDKNVRAKMVGVTISAGGTAAVTDCDVFDMTTEAGGSLFLYGGAGIGGTANTIAAGTLIVDGAIDADAQTDENHALCNLNVSAQSLQLKSGIALKDLSIGHAGRVIATDATITGFDIEAPEQANVGRLYLSSGTVASGGRLNGTGTVNAIYMTDGAKLNEMHVSNGGIFLSANAELTNLDMTDGIVILRGEQTYISGATVTGGDLYLQNGGDGDAITVAGGGLSAYDTDFTNPAGKTEAVNHVTMTDGRIYVGSGATMTDVNATGGTVEVRNGGVLNAVAGNTLNNLNTVAGAKVYVVKAGDNATFQGADTNITDGTLYFSGNAVAGRAENGVFTGFTATQLFKFSFGDGIVVNDVDLNNGEIRVSCFDGASVDTARVSAGAIICNVGAYGTMNNVTLVKAGIMNLSGTAAAYDTVVSSGGQFALNAATVRAENTTLKAGAKFNLNAAGANTGNLLTLDFTGTTGDQAVYINNMANISDDTRIELTGWTENNTYTLTTGAATTKTVHMYNWGLYDDAVAGGATYTNAFYGAAYDFTDGKKIVVNSFDVAAKATAGTITTADVAINGNERVAKWDSATAYSGSVTVAGGGLADDVWLEIDGTNVSTALYGASKEFDKGINLYVRNGEVRNLAAGSRDGDGTVASVKLTLGNANLEGTAYAAGFGSVAGAAETLIEGGTFAKDLYAGALANKLTTATSVGEVSMTIDGGTFSGNIYGASAVKTVAGKNGTRHTASDVTLTVTGGSTTKGTQACIFAGGYATGDATGTVYTVDSVTATISGGSWGEAAGGRGVFGGVMASGVEAEVLGNVNLTVSGDATMGNVYGGGWAQKTNGKSIVGDVNINITGGTIANVFGGGSHSTSGGSTEAGDVTITVSGGNITGAIYAKGQLDGDTTGAANVIFTGAANFGCDVFGYSYVGGAASDAALTFNGYTGEFAGVIGGFDSVTFTDGTAMTLATAAADISNGAWEFDFTDRADTLADTSFLTWDNADFAGDTVKVNFADATQAAAGWSIATAAFDATTTFDLYIGGTEITSVAYDTAIEGGAWDGWKFTSVDGTLKFAQLA